MIFLSSLTGPGHPVLSWAMNLFCGVPSVNKSCIKRTVYCIYLTHLFIGLCWSYKRTSAPNKAVTEVVRHVHVICNTGSYDINSSTKKSDQNLTLCRICEGTWVLAK